MNIQSYYTSTPLRRHLRLLVVYHTLYFILHLTIYKFFVPVYLSPRCQRPPSVFLVPSVLSLVYRSILPLKLAPSVLPPLLKLPLVDVSVAVHNSGVCEASVMEGTLLVRGVCLSVIKNIALSIVGMLC